MFDKLFSLFSHDIGIDLGTANTLLWVKGKGIVVREPSAVAIHRKTKQVVAIGTEAKKMMGKTPPIILTVRPLRSGVISDFDATTAMISYYIRHVHEISKNSPFSFARPKVVIGIPSAVTEVERRAVWEAALSAGAREAYLIEEPMAAAIGEGVSIFQPTGIMVVDIGGGTTEIGVISLGGIVVGRSLRTAGNDMDRAIMHYVQLRHGLLIGESTAEEVKIKIGSAYKGNAKRKTQSIQQAQDRLVKLKNDGKIENEDIHGDRMAIVRGRDIETGLPRSLRITEVEVREALAPILAQVTDGIVDVLEETPPDLMPDILEHGILLTGGGAYLAGLDQLIVERTHMPVVVSDDPLHSVVKGTGKVLEDNELLSRVRIMSAGLK